MYQMSVLRSNNDKVYISIEFAALDLVFNLTSFRINGRAIVRYRYEDGDHLFSVINKKKEINQHIWTTACPSEFTRIDTVRAVLYFKNHEDKPAELSQEQIGIAEFRHSEEG
jgi:hypothetical protein